MAKTVDVQWADGAGTPPGCTRAALRPLVRRAVRAALDDAHVGAADFSVTFLNDTDIIALNREHLRHDGVTDVISFALWQQGEPPTGDIYIGVEQAERQAQAVGVPVTEEIVRLAIHGTLHVLGHDHGAGEDRLDSPMWKLQERLVREVVGT